MKTSLPLLVALALVGCQERGVAPGPSDSTSVRIATSSGGGGSGSNPDSPRPESDVLDTSNLLGPLQDQVGGTTRRLAVFLDEDRSLHLWASSDGAKSGTYDRFTVWTISAVSSDSFSCEFVRPSEPPYRDTLWRTSNGRSWTAELRGIVNAHEFRVLGRPGTLVAFTVVARSGIRPSNWTTGWTPPELDQATLQASLFQGIYQRPIGKSSFRVRLL